MLPIRNGLKQGDDLSPLLFNFALDYAIRRVREKQEGLKLNGAYQILGYVDAVNILGRSIHNTNEYTDVLRFDNKKTGLEVNVDKSKYMAMSRDENARRSHNMKIDNRSFERVEELIYLVITLTHQNSMQDEIQSRLISGNLCYYSVQNRLTPGLLPKCMKIKIYRTLNLMCG